MSNEKHYLTHELEVGKLYTCDDPEWIKYCKAICIAENTFMWIKHHTASFICVVMFNRHISRWIEIKE